MPRAKSTDYEPCPACGGRRWKGLRHPVCDRCARTVLDQAWLDMRARLVRDNATLAVLVPFDAALVADCKETLESQQSPCPFRR